MRTINRLAAIAAMLLLTGCAASGHAAATDATERGLSYVAQAIVLSALLRAFFNK